MENKQKHEKCNDLKPAWDKSYKEIASISKLTPIDNQFEIRNTDI
jgi:hypothetical protein